MSEPAGRTKGIVIPVRQSPYPVSAKETRSCEEEDAEERGKGEKGSGGGRERGESFLNALSPFGEPDALSSRADAS